MKPIRWTDHAERDLRVREIDRYQAEQTLHAADTVVSGRAGRAIYQRRYFDRVLAQEMLLRVIIEETELERVVVTLYKTSKLEKYS